MALENVSGVVPLQLNPEWSQPLPVAHAAAAAALGPAQAADGAAGAPATGKFAEVLMNGLNHLNDSQVEAGQLVQSLLAGQGPEVHTVMLAVEQASLAIEFAVQVRNKIMDAYTEVMHMQV